MARKRQRTILFSEAISDEVEPGPYIRHARARGLSQNTLNDYRTAFGHWLRLVGDRELRSYSADDVELYLSRLQAERVAPAGIADRPARRRAPKTLLNYYVAICALWTWAEARGYTGEHIARQVEAPVARRKPVEPLSREEIVALVRVTAETRPWRSNPLVTSRRSTAERDKALILLLYETALRISEAVNLRAGDILFNRYGGKVRVLAGKGNKDRWLDMGRRTAAALGDYMDIHDRSRPEDPLFINIGRNHGTQMNRTSAGKLIRRLGQRAGIQRAVTPHLLRTTAAMGVLITLEQPSAPMVREAVSAGFYESPGWGQKYPRIQILTVEELLAGKEIQMPPAYGTFKQAEKVKGEGAEQKGLFD